MNTNLIVQKEEALIICQLGATQLKASEKLLAPRSLTVEERVNSSVLRERYELLQRAARVRQESFDYLIYQRGDLDTGEGLNKWEFVPYSKKGWAFWQQLRVLWNISFGGVAQFSKRLPVFELYKNFFQQLRPLVEHLNSGDEVRCKENMFCRPGQLEKQSVLKGKHVHIIYASSPLYLGKERLHFLAVPIIHRATFTEITWEEYKEAEILTQKIINFYKNKGCHTVYRYDKNGTQAGQTVPHWHQHIVLTETKTQEWIGKLSVFKNMLLGSRALKEKDFIDKVNAIREEVKAL